MGIKQRIYEDYIKRSRLPEYKSILIEAKKNGYKMMSIIDYLHIMNAGLANNDNILVNRHDIDTSPKIARAFFKIEQDVYGQSGSATYYFRESTLDIQLIREIEEYGYETGFHYETISTYAKKKHIHNRQLIYSSMHDIRRVFLSELNQYRSITGTKSRTVSGHGDFVNRLLCVYNTEVLSDKETRKMANIECEAYDSIINDTPNVRYADQDLLESFSHEVIKGIVDKEKTIMVLTHPRNWKVDVVANTKDNICRFLQGKIY